METIYYYGELKTDTKDEIRVERMDHALNLTEDEDRYFGRFDHNQSLNISEVPIGTMILENASAFPCVDNVTESDNRLFVTDKTIWTPEVIQRVASLIFIMILSIVGNTIIIIVLNCSRYRKRNSRVNIFIINLAIGDLAVCFVTMTTEILFVAFGEWVLGAAACKILTYVEVVTLASTTFILTSMGFDRYMAICRPFRFRTSITRARRMIFVSWVLAFVFAIPQLFIFVQTVDGVWPDGNLEYGCRSRGYTASWQRKVYFTFMTSYILLIPAVLISYCYIHVAMVVWRQGKLVTGNAMVPIRKTTKNSNSISRAKIKTVKMTFAIIVSFIACWSPYFITTLIKIYTNYIYKIPASVMVFAETVALLQSALNPILYGFFNIQLKRGLMEVFCPDRVYRSERIQNFKLGINCLSLQSSKKYSESGNVRLQEMSSSSSGSFDKGRCHGCIIAEANTNGFKLRVRFMSKDTLYGYDRNSYSRQKDSSSIEQEKEGERVTNESVL